MARKAESEKKKESPPSPSLAFLVGLLLFAMILCPAGVLLSFSVQLYTKLDIIVFHALSLGCIMGLIIAIIPALIFMRATMKKAKKH